MNPLVTIALTTRNRTTYLREIVACALAQDYPNLDILISDNGSSDDTPVLAKKLARSDPRVRFRRNDKGVLQHEHFTQCAREARGEYFILLHDDDWINSSFVSELVAVATRNPDVNVVVPANVTFNEQGTIIREFATPAGEVFDGFTFIHNWLYGEGPQILACLCTILLRTKIVCDFGGYHALTSGRNIDNLLSSVRAYFPCRLRPSSSISLSGILAQLW